MNAWEKPLRVIIMGLDGGTFDLIKPWADEGHLPTFQRLMQEGVWGELDSTMPPITAPAWSSFITGKNPGKHGLVDFVFRRPDSYSVSPINASVRNGRSLWSLLGDGDKKVVVVNVPVTYPPEPVNGLLVTGLMTPSEKSNFTHPPELAPKLRDSGYTIHSPQSYARGNIEKFTQAIRDTTGNQLNHLRRLLKENPWDFAMYVFRGPDRLSHGLWHFMDKTHPLHGAPGTEEHRHAIRDHYQYIDQQLGDMMAEFDNNTVLILMSDHGFGPFHKYIYMNNWLLKWDLLRLRRGPLTRLKKAAFNLGITPVSIYNQMLKLGLGGLKGKVTKGKGNKKLGRFFLSFNDIDWATTTVYSLGNVGQLWINLKGREPMGIVEPGAEYEAARQDTIDRLKAMRDPETGEPMVDEVYTREMLYSGPFLERMPDIVFVPKGFRYLSFGEYEFASNKLVDPSYGITGWHRRPGMALLHGVPIQAQQALQQAKIEDIAPTVLYLMGQQVPGDMDGRVLTEALREEWVSEDRLARAKTDDSAEQGFIEFSNEDEDAVRQRLEDLGYLG
ncbi:MAG: hypothetical protein GY803_06890 [Chloroflexi bacterium]|nr:hypothetical protein [Chloroflexota bacterium]